MSIESRLFYALLRATHYRGKITRLFIALARTGGRAGRNRESRPPGKLARHCHIEKSRILDCNVFTVSSQSKQPGRLILYLHGGAYLQKALKQHWNFIHSLVRNLDNTVVFPDYPLAPRHGSGEVIRMVEACYLEMIEKYNPLNIILMGDSAGGGLALALAQKLRDNPVRQPGHTVLLSPWLDVSMSNPDIGEFEKRDAFLSVRGLQAAGKAYAKDLPTKDPAVSPLYGDCKNLGKITLFIGTYDLLVADSRVFKKICEDQGIDLNYLEYPKMVHVWMLLGFPESKKALDQIHGIIRGN